MPSPLRRDQVAALAARATRRSPRRASRAGSTGSPVASTATTMTAASRVNPKRVSPRAASVGVSAPPASSSKKSPCSRRSASATALDFASSIAKRLSA